MYPRIRPIALIFRYSFTSSPTSKLSDPTYVQLSIHPTSIQFVLFCPKSKKRVPNLKIIISLKWPPPPNYQNQNLNPHITQCSAIFSAPDSCILLRLSQVLLDCSWSNVSKSSKVCCPHTPPPPPCWQFPVGESAPATLLTALVRVLDWCPALVLDRPFPSLLFSRDSIAQRGQNANLHVDLVLNASWQQITLNLFSPFHSHCSPVGFTATHTSYFV